MSSVFDKVAKVRSELKPHQQRVVDRMEDPDQPGLVVAHGLGSGKTLTSIAAQDALGMPAQVVVPAALRENYAKERRKHLVGHGQPAEILSMQNAAVKNLPLREQMLIVDEAHRARDPESSTLRVLANNEAQKRMLLTGSPFYNHPADIAPLVDVAAGKNVLPIDRDDFSKRYIYEHITKPPIYDRLANIFRSRGAQVQPGVTPHLNVARADELQQILNKWVDYHPGSTEGFPTVERRNVDVQMRDPQLEVYDTLMAKAPPWVAAKVKRDLPPSKQEARQLNAFLTASRQAANSTAPFRHSGTQIDEPKIDAAFSNLRKLLKTNPEARAVVYSNYLDAGIKPYAARLAKAGIPHGVYTGEAPQGQRDQMVRDYNEGKLKALLLSSAGGEGLDLKGTRLMQLLEPHWNNEKLHQVEGRGARYLSHAHLPEDQRKLMIETYRATRPQGWFDRLRGKLWNRTPDRSVDEYLQRLSGDKERLIDEFKGLLTPPEES